MREWNELSNQDQVYLWWEYNADVPENEEISFQEFDEMMQGFTFR